MSYHHFTICERGRIEGLHQAGYSARKIGVVMGRHHSSISRELKRGNTSIYASRGSESIRWRFCQKSKCWGSNLDAGANGPQNGPQIRVLK